VGLAVLVSSRAFVDYSTSGLENPLTHLLLALFVLQVARPRAGPRDMFTRSVIAGLAMLNRLDTALFFLPSLVWSVVRARSRRSLGAAVAGMSPPLLWMAFATFYYGHPLPNTAQAKLDAGIGVAELAGRGLHYFLNSLRWDPITLVTIAAAGVVAVVRREGHLRLLALGTLLYLGYVVRIGGDFMSGRFLATPVFCAVCILVCQAWCGAWAAAVLVAGLIAPYPVLLSGSDYGLHRTDLIDDRGVADERAFYFWMSGLFNGRAADKPTNVVVTRARNAVRCGFPVVVEGGVGFLGFVVGPRVHVVDYHGLGDPVLARLPAVDEDPLYVGFFKTLTQRQPRDSFRIGHYLRVVPPGYLSHLLGRDDGFQDPQLRRLVETLDRITRGPLLDAERLRAVVRLNLGRLDSEIDRERYRRWSPPRWDELIAAAPDSAAGYSGLGQQLYATGRLEQATTPLRSALERCPEDTEAAHALAIIRWRSGDAREARMLCERATAIDPEM
jgi:arabinofuranosyltransferase